MASRLQQVRLEELSAELPVLARWMRGVGPHHPWAYPFHGPRPDIVAGFQDMENVLRRLEASRPERLDGKRREFRGLTSIEASLGLRSELIIGADLCRRGVSFSFGPPGKPHPDFFIPSVGAGIELTARKSRPLWDLPWEVQLALTAVKAPPVSLHFAFSAVPHRIRTHVKEDLITEVIHAVQAGESGVWCVVRPAELGEPAITVHVEISRRRSFIPTSTVAGYGQLQTREMGTTEAYKSRRLLLHDLEQDILSALGDKRKDAQARAVPTLLLVDITWVSEVNVRRALAWVRRMRSLFSETHRFVGVGLVTNCSWGSVPIIAAAENPFATAQDNATMKRLAEAMNLHVVA